MKTFADFESQDVIADYLPAKLWQGLYDKFFVIAKGAIGKEVDDLNSDELFAVALMAGVQTKMTEDGIGGSKIITEPCTIRKNANGGFYVVTKEP